MWYEQFTNKHNQTQYRFDEKYKKHTQRNGQRYDE